MAFPLHFLNTLNPILPEGSVDAFDSPKNSLRRVGAGDLRQVDFLYLEEESLKFVSLGEKVNLRQILG